MNERRAHHRPVCCGADGRRSVHNLTCTPCAPSLEGGVVSEEADDAQEPVQRGPDHRGAARAGGWGEDQEVCRRHGIGTTTFYKWKARYGGLEVSEARRLKALEDENRRLKKLLAEALLDVAAPKDLLAKN